MDCDFKQNCILNFVVGNYWGHDLFGRYSIDHDKVPSCSVFILRSFRIIRSRSVVQSWNDIIVLC